MNANKLLRFAEIFYSLASAEELPEDSKETKVILKNIEKLETFNARKKYAEKNLKRLSSGSSRIVYLTKENTVVKMAKNDKGLAQNKAENKVKKSKFINKILKHAANFSWIEVPFAKKVSRKEFKKLSGIDFADFDDCIRYVLRANSGNMDKEKPDNLDDIKKHKMFKELSDIGKANKLMGGDLARISSWGRIDDNLVLIDAGLTKNVFEEYYES